MIFCGIIVYKVSGSVLVLFTNFETTGYEPFCFTMRDRSEICERFMSKLPENRESRSLEERVTLMRQMTDKLAAELK